MQNQQSSNIGNMTNSRKAQKDLFDAYEIQQQSFIENKIQQINNAAANKQSALAWKIVNEISGRKNTNKSKLKANSQSERLDKWKEHFQNLLGNTPSISNNEIERIVNEILDIK